MRQFQIGFTLIELLVVLGIAALMFSLGFAAYREFDTRQRLSEAVNLLKADLFLAQQQALSAVKPAGCSGNLNGWRLGVSTSTSYQIAADCGVLGWDGDVVTKTVTLPQGITQTTGISVNFKVLAQGIVDPGDVVFTLTQTSTGTTATITVTRAGSIY